MRELEKQNGNKGIEFGLKQWALDKK